ncbi:cytochrome P450 [Kineosporia sp. J2-2]|uniref:Cytochrome P450 n=1 Tax=Kineosporia corallincola TaxID=2835133 RepID=A0ABS5TEV4_9ACTN|nr:cytochrome P450 [Kineosporia corallincola]MBT0769623.1 cytochrome P450 [Kineosporia corallincola]
MDALPALLREGYLWLPHRRSKESGAATRGRLAGLRFTGVEGSDALRFFYDENNIRRSGAMPEPILSTLFGHGAVHTLDGEEHRHRKAVFTHLLMPPESVAGLTAAVMRSWEAERPAWAGRERVVLFDASARVLTRAVSGWAGLDPDEGEIDRLRDDLVAMVDGFATAGPRHWRARAARYRRERWLSGIVREVRAGTLAAREGTALEVIARHRDRDGVLLPERVAAVEVLNVLRPTVAICWFVTYAAHALHFWPQHRERLAAGDTAFATAFQHEVRRYYPFAPFIGGRAARDTGWAGTPIPGGSMVLPDLYGQNHDERVFPRPYDFRPERFVENPPGEWDLVPQGAGDPETGHRCPGERIVVGVLEALSMRLAASHYRVPPQNLHIRADRIPARVASGFVVTSFS